MSKSTRWFFDTVSFCDILGPAPWTTTWYVPRGRFRTVTEPALNGRVATCPSGYSRTIDEPVAEPNSASCALNRTLKKRSSTLDLLLTTREELLLALVHDVHARGLHRVHPVGHRAALQPEPPSRSTTSLEPAALEGPHPDPVAQAAGELHRAQRRRRDPHPGRRDERERGEVVDVEGRPLVFLGDRSLPVLAGARPPAEPRSHSRAWLEDRGDDPEDGRSGPLALPRAEPWSRAWWRYLGRPRRRPDRRSRTACQAPGGSSPPSGVEAPGTGVQLSAPGSAARERPTPRPRGRGS